MRKGAKSNAIIIGAWFGKIPKAPSIALPTKNVDWPSNTIASGVIICRVIGSAMDYSPFSCISFAF